MLAILRKNSLTKTGTIIPRAMKMELTERGGSASPEITGDDPPGIGEWMKITDGPGKGTVWRVKIVEDSHYTGASYTLQLEHIISTLKDRILPGETTPATITGNKNATSCTARQAINYILGHQDEWRLGDLEAEKTAPYNFNGDSLYDCIETVCGALKDVYWEYDLSSYPFKLHIRKITSDAASEMRLHRNITGQMRMNIDRGGMYTRIWPIGKNNLKLKEQYLSRNTSTYGIIDHTETDGSMDTEEKLRAWAQERLERHSEPKVTVTVPGLDLSESTGESMDRIRLNRVCRIPVPKYGTTIRERVTKLSWPDCVGQPESLTVTLANNLEDVASIIRNMSKSSGKGSRVGAQKDEEDHAWFEDTTEHVSMVAETIIGQSPDGVDWKRVAELTVDTLGIHGRVTKTEGDLVVAEARIEVNEENIALEVKRAGEAEAQLQVQADAISARVTTAEGNIGKLEVRSDKVEARVSTAEGNIGKLTVRSDRIEGRVQSAEGNISTLTQTATSLTSRITSAEGNVSTLQQTANGLTSRVSTAEGNISTLTQTANGLTSRVSTAESNISTLQQTATSIQGTVSTLTESNQKLEGKVIVAAGQAALTASLTDSREVLPYARRAVFPSTGNVNYLYYDTEQNKFYEWKNGSYSVCAGPGARIAAANIVASINDEDESEVHIDSDHVYIGNQKSTTVINGKLTASDITAEFLDAKISTIATMHGISALFSGNVSCSALMASQVYVGSSAPYTNISDGIKEIQISGPTSNVYTLQYKKFSDSDWQDAGTFSRATTLSGAWSGSTYTVKASPQNKTNSTTIYMATEGGGASTNWDDSVFHTTPGISANRITKLSHWLQLDSSNDRAIVRKDTADGAIVTQVSLSTYKQTAYNSGYDASHSMFIADSSSTAVTSKSIGPGESVELWPGFLKTDESTYQWGTKVTVTASNPYSSWKTLKCTGVRTDSGLTTYTFTYQNTNSGMFSSNTNYTFHHNSGYT